MRHFQRYPVIYLNFKNDSSVNYESVINYLKSEMSVLFEYQRNKIDENVFIKNLSGNDKIKWKKIEEGNEDSTSLNNFLKFLTRCLHTIYKKKCVVLIDEYDKMLLLSIQYNYYKEIKENIESLYTDGLKSNKDLYIGILTGCLDIGLKSLFSTADCYGFTEEELDRILKNFNFSEIDRNKIREKYDGYSCPNNEYEGIVENLYNPYTIINFIQSNENSKEKTDFKNYWSNTGSDIILRNIIVESKFNFEKIFLKLITGSVIEVTMNLNFDLREDYNNKNIKSDVIWYI